MKAAVDILPDGQPVAGVDDVDKNGLADMGQSDKLMLLFFPSFVMISSICSFREDSFVKCNLTNRESRLYWCSLVDQFDKYCMTGGPAQVAKT